MAQFYFWQNMVAIHQVHWLRDLASRHDVRWLVDEELDADRAGQGWHRPDTGNIKVSVVRPSDVAGILSGATADAIHVFSPRGCVTGKLLLTELNRRGLRYALLVEKPLGTGFALVLRGGLYWKLAWQTRRRVAALGMGDIATGWFRRHGFNEVTPFGYTVADADTSVVEPEGASYRFVCAAQLISRKDHATLLRALAALSGDWTLECIGRGPLDGELKSLAASLGLSRKVIWTQSLPNAEARDRVAKVDTLVLASIWEGWGAVVNEALAEGTRVVVSDASGASCLLGLGDVGESFPAGDVAALTDALRRQMERGRVLPDERAARRHLHSRVNGPAMAVYFEKIMAGEKPSPPWRVS